MATTCFALGKQVRQVDKRIYTPSMRERSHATRWLEVGSRASHVYAVCVTEQRRTDELKDKVGRQSSVAVIFWRRMAIQLLIGFRQFHICWQCLPFHFADCLS